jgi:hypothetical protein
MRSLSFAIIAGDPKPAKLSVSIPRHQPVVQALEDMATVPGHGACGLHTMVEPSGGAGSFAGADEHLSPVENRLPSFEWQSGLI